jgi:hypothetical protein
MKLLVLLLVLVAANSKIIELNLNHVHKTAEEKYNALTNLKSE